MIVNQARSASGYRSLRLHILWFAGIFAAVHRNAYEQETHHRTRSIRTAWPACRPVAMVGRPRDACFSLDLVFHLSGTPLGFGRDRLRHWHDGYGLGWRHLGRPTLFRDYKNLSGRRQAELKLARLFSPNAMCFKHFTGWVVWIADRVCSS